MAQQIHEKKMAMACMERVSKFSVLTKVKHILTTEFSDLKIVLWLLTYHQSFGLKQANIFMETVITSNREYLQLPLASFLPLAYFLSDYQMYTL